MSKAILVIEMPECCADCPCSFFERSNPKLNLVCGPEGEDANNIGKPDWCPLRPMPEKNTSLSKGIYNIGRKEGWNACVDKITGEQPMGKILWIIDKENNKICYSDGKFHTATRDWNYDGDVYTDTVMIIHYLNGTYLHIHKCDLQGYEPASEEQVRNTLYEELDKYFLKGDGYYCDPTYFGNHYGDYGFLEGGHCVYEDETHRKEAIGKEVDYIIKRSCNKI